MATHPHMIKLRGKWVTSAEYSAAIAAERSARNATRGQHADNAVGAAATAPRVDTPAKATAATDPADPAEIAEYCAANGLAHRAADFIRNDATMEEVRAAADGISRIEKAFRAAREVNTDLPTSLRDDAVRGYTEGTITIHQASHLFLNALVDLQSPEIAGQLSSSSLAGEAAGNYGWDRALATAGRRINS